MVWYAYPTYCLLRRVVSISGALKAHPTAVALRFIQRRILMSDPNWLDGHYYGKTFPKVGMQNARYTLAVCGCAVRANVHKK